jgi:hypothetical protein
MTKIFASADATTDATTDPNASKSTSWLDAIKYGVNIWSADQQRQAQADTAAAALKLENLKLQELKQQGTNASSATSKISAYAVPIAVTGIVVALGIATYFYFRKKKA